jgi:hypothetical protein
MRMSIGVKPTSALREMRSPAEDGLRASWMNGFGSDGDSVCRLLVVVQGGSLTRVATDARIHAVAIPGFMLRTLLAPPSGA